MVYGGQYNQFLLKLHMQIDFIELEHRENVLQLMEMCGLDMNEAYQLYMNSNCNVDTAVNTHLGLGSQPSQVRPQIVNPSPYEGNHYQQQNQYYNDYQQDDKYSQYKRFLMTGPTFQSKYPVRKSQSFFKSLIPSFLKGDQEGAFKRQLEQTMGRTTKIKSQGSSLSENMNYGWKEKYPVLVILLDCLPENRGLYSPIFTDDSLVELVFNMQFRAYGINTKEYQLQQEYKDVVDLARDNNSIVILRVTCLDEIKVMGRLKLDIGKDELKNRLKKIKSECIQEELQDAQIIRQYSEQLRGNFNYQRPKTIKENIKERQDRQIRRKQEQEFFQACKPRETQVKPQGNRQENRREVASNEQAYAPIKKQQPKVDQAQILRQRQKKHSGLKQYTQGITFKIRVPSGENFLVTVDPSQRVQYIFDWIQSNPKDIGFSNPAVREFDIVVGFGGSEKLKGRQGERVGEVFEGAEVLIVREM